MRWRRSTRPASATGPAQPVVLSTDRPLTGASARDLADQVERLAEHAPVVVDLTAIPAFDSAGTETLAELQERSAPGQVSIVGLRQAAARLVGADALTPSRTPVNEGGWVVRRMRKLAVVQADPAAPGGATGALEGPLSIALTEDVALVVLGLRDAVALAPSSVHAIAFASSEAALRGQELLVVNVTPQLAEALRRVGLSATTYVAPEELPDAGRLPTPTD